jgi:gliding motility-associated-like protein
MHKHLRTALLLSIGIFCTASLHSQTTIWLEDFSGTNQGWTQNFTDCDGTPQSFAGKRNNRFEEQDMEGAPCCGTGGANGNVWEIDSLAPISISGYCNVSISVNFGSTTTTLECSSPTPIFACQGNPTFDNGHDQMVFYYSLDGGPWVQFFYQCGNAPGTNTASIGCLSGSTLRVRIMPATKAIDEIYWFDNVKIVGTPLFSMTQPNDVVICPGLPVAVAFAGGPTGATYTWTNDNPAVGLAASGTGNISFTSANVATQQVANVVVTPHQGACCAGTPVTFTITVNPAPTVTVPANITVCATDPVSATFGGTGTTFNWTNSNANIGLPGSGSGDISFTSAAVTTTQTGTITVTPSDAATNCNGAPKTFTITVNPLPAVNPPNNVTACGGSAVAVNFTGTAGTTYMWTNDNTSIGLGATGTGNISFTSTAVSAQEVALITITPKTATCTGTPVTFTITINPTPTVTTPANVVACGGAAVMVTFQGANSPTFNWTNSNPAIGLPSTGNGDLNFSAANVVTTKVATITVTPVANGCTGIAHTFTITVNPSPTVNLPANINTCGGNPVSVVFNGTPGATDNWTNDNPNIGLAASGTGNINFTSAVVATQQVANITVTPQNANCTGTSQTFTITINPPPTVTAPANQTACAGMPVAVTFAGTGNPTFNWTNSNNAIGLGATGTGNISFNSANVASPQVATITVTPSVAGCAGTAKTFTITVSPIPTANTPANQTACAGGAVAVNFTGSAGASFDWTNSNAAIGLGASGTGNISFTSAAVTTQQVATVTVTPKIGTSCAGTPVTFTITINPAPVVNPVSNVTVCGGQPVSVNLTGTGTAYSWTNSNTAIGLGATGTGNISFTSTNPGTGTIVVTPTGGACPGIPLTFTITVQSPPTVTAPADQVTCSNSPLTVNFTGTGNPTFNWTNSNTAIGLPASGTGNISFTASNAASNISGTITVTPVAGTCSGTPQTFTITVTPILSVNQPADVISCGSSPVAVTFTGTSGVAYTWTNSNTAIGLPASGTGNLNFTAAAVSTQQVATITVAPQAGQCAGPSASFFITINPTPVVNASTDQTACSNQPISVTFTGTASAYNWTNDNTAIGLGASGTGDISFTTANIASNQTGILIATPAAGPTGCQGAPDTFLITVVTTPALNTMSNPAACSGDSVTVPFTGTAGTTFTWTNSNPAIGLPASGSGNLHFQAATVTVPTSGTLTVLPQIGTCIGNPVIFTITINPIPSMTAPGNLTACPGNVIQVNYQGSPANVGFAWSNDNPAIGLPASGTGNLNFMTINPGATSILANLSVKPTVAGCSGPAATFTISVNPAPKVSPIGSQTVCQGQPVTVHFTGVTNPVFNWNNSNPNIGLPASGTGDISFTAAGVVNAQTASIIVTPTENGCTGPVQTFNITVAPAPTMTAPADTAICAGQPLQIGFVGSTAATFSWTNDNPAIGLSATGTGTPNFTTAAVTTQMVGHLTVTPQIGTCSGPSVAFAITVNPLPVINPTADQTVCSGQNAAFNLTGSAGAVLNWTSSNPAIGLAASGVGNISFTAGAVATNATSTIVVSPSGNGCTGLADTFDVTILALPQMNPPADQMFCSGTTGAVSFSGPAGNTFAWTNDNPAIGLPASGSGDISFTSANTTSQLVGNITVTPQAGTCSGAPVSFTVTIHPAPAMTQPADVLGCAGQQIGMGFSGGPAGTTYNWTNNNTATGLGASGTGNINFQSAAVTSTQSGKITITPVEGGCSGQPLTANIIVNPLPTANPVADKTVCANAAVTINFSGTAGASYSWTNTNTAIGLGATGTGNISFNASNVAANQTGIITITPSSGSCVGQPQFFNIIVDALPVANNPGNQNVCAKGSLAVNLTGTPGATFSWTNSNPTIGLPASGTGNPSFTAANTTTVKTATITITPQAGTCAGTPVSFTITVNPAPAAAITGSLSVCTGFSITLTATGGSAYVWNGNQTTAAITVSPVVNTTYTVTVTSTASCTATAVASVAVHQPSAITLQKTSCLPADTGVVVQTLHNQFGCDSVVTIHTSLLPSSLVNLTQTTCHKGNAGVFTKHFTNHVGCDSTVITTIVFDPALIDTTLLSTTTCNPNQVGTSQVLLTGSNGCDSLVISQVVYDPALCGVIASIQATGVSCASSTDGSATIKVSNGVPPFQYSWKDGAGNTGTGQINALNTSTQFPSLAPGTFVITVTQSVGLSTVLTAQISAPAPVVAQAQAVLAFNQFAVSCNGSADGSANGQASGGTPPYQYAWNNGTTTNPASGLKAGNYTVTVTDAKGCTGVATTALTAPPPLSFTTSLARPDCSASTVAASFVPSGGLEPYTFSVDGTDVTGTGAPVTGGVHLIEVTDDNGCKVDSSITVVIPSAAKIQLPADTTIDLGQSLTIEAQTNLIVWKSITWQPVADTSCLDCLTQTWAPVQSDLYTVIIVDTFGCTAKATTRITVHNKAAIYIPNVFLPNDNGRNDLFQVNAGPGVTSIDEIQIFDRWGNMIYAWTSPVLPNEWPGWDGKSKGQKVGPGVYVYYFKIKLLNGNTEVIKGDITVVK